MADQQPSVYPQQYNQQVVTDPNYYNQQPPQQPVVYYNPPPQQHYQPPPQVIEQPATITVISTPSPFRPFRRMNKCFRSKKFFKWTLSIGLVGVLLVIGGILFATLRIQFDQISPWYSPVFCKLTNQSYYYPYVPRTNPATCPTPFTTRNTTDQIFALQKEVISKDVYYVMEIAKPQYLSGSISVQIENTRGSRILSGSSISFGSDTISSTLNRGEQITMSRLGAGFSVFPDNCVTTCKYSLPEQLYVSTKATARFKVYSTPSDYEFPYSVTFEDSSYIYDDSSVTSGVPMLFFRFRNDVSDTSSSDSGGRFVGTFLMCTLGSFTIIIVLVICCVRAVSNSLVEK